MARVAHLAFQKLEAALGRRQRGVVFDALPRQRAEKPELAGLQRQELLPRRGELAVAQRFEVAAVILIDGGGQVKVHHARLEKVAAAFGLFAERRCRGRFRCGSPRNGGRQQKA